MHALSTPSNRAACNEPMAFITLRIFLNRFPVFNGKLTAQAMVDTIRAKMQSHEKSRGNKMTLIILTGLHPVNFVFTYK